MFPPTVVDVVYITDNAFTQREVGACAKLGLAYDNPGVHRTRTR